MIAEKLRKSILQAAIQGKLTDRLPEDGDAKELLEAIKAEKAQLVKEGRIKKEKPLPDIMEDEIPFDIPENWCWCRIGHIFTLQAGKFISSDSIKSEGKYPCYGGNGLRGYVDICNRAGRFPLIGRQGALCGNINIADGEFYATEHAVVVQGYCNYIADWAAHFLTALNLNQYATATAQPGLAVNKINQIVFPLPPLAEQQRIVLAIEKTLEKIKALEKDELKLDLLQKSFPKKMKDSLLQAAIQGKLTEQLESDGDARALVADIQEKKERLIKEGKIKKEKALPKITEDELPFDIPDNWCWVRVQDIAYLNSGKSYENVTKIASGNNALYIKVSDMNIQENKVEINTSEHYISMDKISENDIIPVKSIIFPKRGGAILTNKRRIVNRRDVVVDTNTMAMTSIFGDCFKYLCIWLNTYDFKELCTGTSVPQINNKDIYPLLIPLPPLAEQQRIVERLEQLLPLCDALE